MGDISWDGIDKYRIPEWEPKFIAMGGKYTYLDKELVDFFPAQREALVAAIENGTAQAIKNEISVCPTCGNIRTIKHHLVDSMGG